jgi:hypothetical protein
MARLTLEALFAHVLDYAGLFPPSSLPVDDAVENYREYKRGAFGWILGRFVVDERRLDAIPRELDRHLAVLAEHDHERAAAIETKTVVTAAKPVYCEVGMERLSAVAEAGSFAKVRTGGITPDAIPSSEALATFIHACARRHLPFKATAGLHHSIRSVQALTEEPDSPRALMHGFLNLLLASTLAWHGADIETVQSVLEETDQSAFRFAGEVRWRDERLRFEDILSARRNFIHSFGSCSFTGPVDDLKRLGWL